MKFLNRILGNDSGNVLVISIISSTIMIGVAGMAVDYGNAIVQEAKLQDATDVAALAGVQELPYSTFARTKMSNYFQQNYTRSAECTTEFGSTQDVCYMTASHAVPTFFMRIFGQDALTVHARAKAKLEGIEGLSGGRGIVPFGLLNPSKNGNPNDDLTAANNGKPYVLKYGSDNIMVEDWWAGRQIVGSGVTHTEGSLPNGGWRAVLGLDPNSTDPTVKDNSANSFRTNFGEGWKGSVEIGDIIGSNPGTMTSGTTQGRDNRLSGYTSTQWSGFDGNLDPMNHRIIVVPIVSVGKYVNGVWHQSTSAEVAAGDYDWKVSRVDGFAAFFLLSESEMLALPGGNNIDRKWVVGRFMYGMNIGGKIITPGDSGGPDYGMKQGRLIPF